VTPDSKDAGARLGFGHGRYLLSVTLRLSWVVCSRVGRGYEGRKWGWCGEGRGSVRVESRLREPIFYGEAQWATEEREQRIEENSARPLLVEVWMMLLRGGSIPRLSCIGMAG
jgi:hypothetical protein